MSNKEHNKLMSEARLVATRRLIAARKDDFAAFLKEEQDKRGVAPMRVRLSAEERAAKAAEKAAAKEAKKQARLQAEADKIAARLTEIEKSLAA